jgi:hypothetical protein
MPQRPTVAASPFFAPVLLGTLKPKRMDGLDKEVAELKRATAQAKAKGMKSRRD